MSDLKTEITDLETKMLLETEIIDEQNKLLREEDLPTSLLPAISIGCVVAGFLFARKKSVPALIKGSAAILLSSKRMYKIIKPFI